ncbi:TPA: hypothetical protein ACN310_004564 [Vibrio parahaemolyticus]|uniref:hypothetical protein n=1 Tax=Vibrio parahaemolyticus TaxID=670 RepID=UPI00097656F4|nr:hypothetical protein [Vibrio parahaemolyticus]EJE4701727.1 hypothetical protein [Vibrio parahaemolyticus]ELA9559931.1 hypothetical protein [Vibrio parahaemolyticus]OMP47671.1 hypothetical protein BBM19_23640 [Vibrio parahaemolyticus]TXM29196.1 hypothetical protein FVP00_25045 [Vibrio parahaemolyticus]
MALVSAKISTYQKDKTNCFCNHFDLSDNINIKSIKSINSSATTLTDKILNSTISFAKDVENYRKKIKLSESDLLGLEFSIGGANKNKNIQFGILYAKNQIGKNDFLKEKEVSNYCRNKPGLSRVVSLQTQDGLPDHFVSKKYATFAVYDDNIKSEMLSDLLLSGLNMEQAKSLACQFIDILKTLYINKVSHNDLHKENLLILKDKNQSSLLMKLIDFGRSKIGSEFDVVKFNDIDYVFFNKGSSVLETTARNVLTPVVASMHYSPAIKIKQKHKPLHGIIKSCRNTNIDIDKELVRIGEALKGALTLNSANYMAFDDAKKSVCLLISRAFGFNEK